MQCLILTGASRGLGAALARCLPQAGDWLITLERQPDALLQAWAQQHHVVLRQHRCDLSEPSGQAANGPDAIITNTVASLPADCTRIVLVNNAGRVQPIGMSEHRTAAEVARAINLNLTTVIVSCDALINAVRRRYAGQQAPDVRILNVSSGAGRRAASGWAVYCATKAGLDNFSASLALDLQHQGQQIRVESMAPGIVDTDMQAEIRAQDESQHPSVEMFRAFKRDGALASAEQTAAKMAQHLMSDAFGNTVLTDIRQL